MRTTVCAALSAIVLAVLGAAAAPPEPVSWRVERAPKEAVKVGQSLTVRLVASIQEGWHFYSMRPIDDGPIPTRVWIAEGQPFQLSGPVRAQDPELVQDATLQKEVELYQGEAWFDLPVRIAEGASGARKIVVSVSYQSCNNKLCLPPKTIRVEVPVTVAK